MNDFGFVLATKMLVEGRRKVRFMYREQPDNPSDSGWRFFCGNEEQSYVDDPEHIGLYDINTILNTISDEFTWIISHWTSFPLT